jgi:hypothetical protein
MSDEPEGLPLIAPLLNIRESVRRMDAASGWGSDAVRDAVVGMLAQMGLPIDQDQPESQDPHSMTQSTD